MSNANQNPNQPQSPGQRDPQPGQQGDEQQSPQRQTPGQGNEEEE